jgi:hypothetical protein
VNLNITDADTIHPLSVSIVSIIRMKVLLEISFTDITYTLPQGMMWTVLEPELALICANIALMRTLVAKVFPRWFATKHSYAANRQRFQHLEEGQDQYPLNRIRVICNKKENAGPEQLKFSSWSGGRAHGHSRGASSLIDSPPAVPSKAVTIRTERI